MFQTNQPQTNMRANPKSGLSRGLNLIQLQDVHVQFNDIVALRSVHLNILKGEILFVTGVSGAGKSTLLRVIAQEQMPTSGRVIHPRRTECFISQVYQDLRIERDQTCQQNLEASFDKTIYKKRSEFDSDLSDLCQYLGIKSRLNLKMREANGGLKQKVAIVRSLLTRPDLFIADEPTSSLDAENSKKIFDLLNLYNVKRGMTIVWASHNRDLIRTMAGKNIHLDQGRLIYAGHACFI
jgi:ABC-type ATPase involved in cell division